jgi:cell division protein FtsB
LPGAEHTATIAFMRFFAVAFVLLAVLGYTLLRAPARQEIARMRTELRGLEKQIEALRAQNRAFVRETAWLRDEPAALERVARHEYGLVRGDEWVLPPASKLTLAAAPSTETRATR